MQLFDVSRAGSYISSHDPRIIAGLGADGAVAEIAIHWPGGRMQKIVKSQIDCYHVVREKESP